MDLILYLSYVNFSVISPKGAKIFENHILDLVNPVMLVFIGKLSSTLRRVPMCQGFSIFSAFLHYVAVVKLATSSLRDKARL